MKLAERICDTKKQCRFAHREAAIFSTRCDVMRREGGVSST
jgi:hypothetical protein